MVTRAASSNSVKSVHPPPPRARVRVYLVFFFPLLCARFYFLEEERRSLGGVSFWWNIYILERRGRKKRSSFEGKDLFE